MTHCLCKAQPRPTDRSTANISAFQRTPLSPHSSTGVRYTKESSLLNKPRASRTSPAQSELLLCSRRERRGNPAHTLLCFRTCIETPYRAYAVRCTSIQGPIDCGQSPCPRVPGQPYDGFRGCYYAASRIQTSANHPYPQLGEKGVGKVRPGPLRSWLHEALAVALGARDALPLRSPRHDSSSQSSSSP
jgi:hypothetical protein